MNTQILVLFEGWSASDEAVRYAHALAQRIEGKLILLLLLQADTPDAGEVAALTERCHAFLRAQVDGFDDGPIEKESYVRIGDPWSEFCKFAATAGRFHMAVWASGAGLVNGRPVATHWVSRIQSELGCPVVTAHRRSR